VFTKSVFRQISRFAALSFACLLQAGNDNYGERFDQPILSFGRKLPESIINSLKIGSVKGCFDRVIHLPTRSIAI